MENPTIQEIFQEWNDHRLQLKKISNTNKNKAKEQQRHSPDIAWVDLPVFFHIRVINIC